MLGRYEDDTKHILGKLENIESTNFCSYDDRSKDVGIFKEDNRIS